MRADVASRLSLLTLVVGLSLFGIDRFMGVPLTGDSFMTLVLALMGALSWALLKTRQYNSVAWLLVLFLYGMAAASAWFYGSVRTTNILLILVGQVASGIFLSRQGLVGATLAAIGLLGVLTWADAQDLLAGQPRFDVTWRTWLSQSICLMGVTSMMYLNRTQMLLAQDMHLKEAAQRLRSQLDRDIEQDRFSRLFHASPTPIYVQSARSGAILEVNEAFERTLGYAGSEVLNRRDGFLWLHDDAYQHFAQERRSSLRTSWCPVTALCRDGRELAVEASSERDEDMGQGLVITALRVPGNHAAALPTLLAPLEEARRG